MSRYTMPAVLAVQHTAIRGGNLVLLGRGDDGQDTLRWVGDDDVRTIPLDVLRPGKQAPWPSLLAHPEGGVVVVRDLETAQYFDGPTLPRSR